MCKDNKRLGVFKCAMGSRIVLEAPAALQIVQPHASCLALATGLGLLLGGEELGGEELGGNPGLRPGQRPANAVECQQRIRWVLSNAAICRG